MSYGLRSPASVDFEHEATCVDLRNAGERIAELERKADDAHERTRSHRQRCRRAMKEHTKSEAAINHNLGCFAWRVRDTANATHALTCGVSDRESNETKYLFEASAKTFREPRHL